MPKVSIIMPVYNTKPSKYSWIKIPFIKVKNGHHKKTYRLFGFIPIFIKYKTERCPVCGHSAKLKTNIPGYQEPLHFDIFACPHCKVSFCGPKISPDLIYENIYKNSDRVPGYDRYYRYAENVKNCERPFRDYLANTEETYWAIGAALNKISTDKDKLKMLEVGSGMGYLTYSLRRDGYDIVGMDISENAVNRARENFGDFYVCADATKINTDKKYDVIMMTEVIEHVYDPVSLLSSLMNMLKPGGKIIATTPNKSLYSDTIYWNTEAPPIHTLWIGEKTMKIIAKKIGADLEFIDFSDYYAAHPGIVDANMSYHRNSFLAADGQLLPPTVTTQTVGKPSETDLGKRGIFIGAIFSKR